MDFKIVIDSCGEIPEEKKASGLYENVPLELEVDGYRIVDDETFDQLDFIRRVALSPTCPKSSCPSPKQYMNAFENGGAKRIYCSTLSAQLSGSYNSALLGAELFLEEHPDCKVHVFDSKSASMGETLIGFKVEELEAQGLSFEEIVEQTEAYIDGMNTYFVLETLDSLRKNGRLTGLKAVVATALNIKPVMAATPIGSIYQVGQARGINKGLKLMVKTMLNEVVNPEEKILTITHCNCYARALAVREEALKGASFKDVIILDTRGVTSLYASDGGVVISV